MTNRSATNDPRPEHGVAILEILVSMALIGLACIAIVRSTQSALMIGKYTEAHYAASSLAASRVEQLAAVPVATLDAAFNESSTELTWPGLSHMTFSRSTVITINSDDSRTIDVTVASDSTTLPTSVSFSTRFAYWE